MRPSIESMTHAPKSRAAAGAASVALSLMLVLSAGLGSISAQDRTTVIRVLEEGHDFRARVRAARALGSSGDATMADHLVRALADESAAVRAAAAEGLGRLANPSSLAALRRASHDPESEVREAAERAIRALSAATPPPPTRPTTPGRPPVVVVPPVLPPSRTIDWARTSYVVVLGSLVNHSGFSHAPLEAVLRQEVNRSLLVLRGVAVLTPSTPRAEADREIAARHLPQYRLEGTISRVRPETHGRDLQVRCEVSLVLMDEPSHNIRAALNGAATGTEPLSGVRAVRERALAEQALMSATRSAMSGAARAITSSSH